MKAVVNPDFFKTWSPEMAYVLGFFAADGYMIKNKRGGRFIDFYNNDLEILKKIQKVIRSNHKISSRLRDVNQATSYRIQIGSKSWFEDLTALGFMQGKSKVLEMPTISTKYLPHFVRGYFDGDGNIWSGHTHKLDRPHPTRVLAVMFTCGSKKFVATLQEQLKIFAKLKGGSITYHDRAYRLSYSTQDALRLYSYMYLPKSSLHLPRKKVRFEEFLTLRT